ncbi:MAG: hypothetical protein ACLR2E_11605 [Lachnospiraceae bacterium]
MAVAGIYYFKKPISERNRAFRTEMESTQGAVAEMLEMIPVTRAHGLQEVEINKCSVTSRASCIRAFSSI